MGANHAGAKLDAIVVGAGPNGLTAAIVLARAGFRVRVYEGESAVGGGARTREMTLPGIRHDPCSAVHPLAAGSPVLGSFPLEEYGLEWIHPGLPLAHPFPDGSAALLSRSVAETAAALGGDGHAYRSLVGPFLGRWDTLAPDVLRPVLDGVPRHPLRLARFGARAIAPAAVLARAFRGERARGLLAGLAAHAIAPLSAPATGGVALMFALAAHEVGWPIPRGGSQAISDALAGYLTDLGGEITTGHPVARLEDLPPARVYLLDTVPGHGPPVAPGPWAGLRRPRRGPGVFKLDYALAEPVPWAAEACRRAGTVHIGPTMPEIARTLRDVSRDRVPHRPFLIVAQPSLFDPTRGGHVLWVYAHVPHGWRGDLTEAVEARIEAFAPGFGDTVLARTATGPAAIAAHNPNYAGGDIGGGRPIVPRHPYATGDPAVFYCSAATPPGPGVHGMCGYHAARRALRRLTG